MRLDLKKPCEDCPFRNDRYPYISYDRAVEISEALLKDESFSCHKMDRGEWIERGNEKQHCAGAMIMLEHMNNPNQWMRCMERLGFYNRSELVMNSNIFKSNVEFINHHKRVEKCKD